MARLSLDDHLAAAEATPPVRDLVGPLTAPGLHLIAEIKRASPSAGDIAAPDEDIVARARAYEAGGATAISVLCEPHWFGGSVDDLRAIRAAVAIPVLAKEFVVEAIQLPHLRAAGADAVLLLAVLHPARRLARLVDRALEIGLEPLVEAHDERELERALATKARLMYEDTLRQVQADIRTQSDTLASGRERIANLGAALLPAADQRVQLATAAYRAGTGSLADTFAARRAQLEVQLQVLDLRRDVSQTWAQLEYQVVPSAMAAAQ